MTVKERLITTNKGQWATKSMTLRKTGQKWMTEEKPVCLTLNQSANK